MLLGIGIGPNATVLLVIDESLWPSYVRASADWRIVEMDFDPTQEIVMDEIALVSPPGSTNAGSDTLLTFQQQVQRIFVQNNTAADVWVNADAVSAVGKRWKVAATQMLAMDIPCLVLHLFTAAAQTINSGSAGVSIAGYFVPEEGH